LGTLGGASSVARAINARGEVVGQSNTANGAMHAFLWSKAAGMRDLGTLPGLLNSSAASIDDKGRIVGSSFGPDSLPFMWTPTGGMRQLGPFGNLKLQSADGLNNAAQILLSRFVARLGQSGPTSWLLSPIMHTTLKSSANPSTVGALVTLTATVNSPVQGPPPDGEIVAFRIVNGRLLGKVPLKAGVAKLTLELKESASIQATYKGDVNYASSQSPSLDQVVQ